MVQLWYNVSKGGVKLDKRKDLNKKTKKELVEESSKLSLDCLFYNILTIVLGVSSLSFFSVGVGSAIAEKTIKNENFFLVGASVLVFIIFGHASNKQEQKLNEKFTIDAEIRLIEKRQKRAASSKI